MLGERQRASCRKQDLALGRWIVRMAADPGPRYTSSSVDLPFGFSLTVCRYAHCILSLGFVYFIPDVPLPILFFLSSPPLLFCSLVPGEKLGLDDALQLKSFFDKTAYEFPTIAEIEEYDINTLQNTPPVPTGSNTRFQQVPTIPTIPAISNSFRRLLKVKPQKCATRLLSGENPYLPYFNIRYHMLRIYIIYAL